MGKVKGMEGNTTHLPTVAMGIFDFFFFFFLAGEHSVDGSLAITRVLPVYSLIMRHVRPCKHHARARRPAFPPNACACQCSECALLHLGYLGGLHSQSRGTVMGE